LVEISISSDIARRKQKFNHNRFSEMFSWVINSYELIDVSLNGGLYTWSNNQANLTLEKLDRDLISPEWKSTFHLTNLRKKPSVTYQKFDCFLMSEFLQNFKLFV
jgi:hypothetical protein